ncbi:MULTISPECIES: hypothetical protein [Flavobacteriaceae]|uniref:virginiamycin B lyase family protein n=1 Tax=Flavobacteriaceae TaxID=49546 RepID=UPI0014926631|nr:MULTISPECIES: hypothetical protein [Allomuricauda]MDC6367545.1 hypothetical protein [Muricauda sp. AC10]
MINIKYLLHTALFLLICLISTSVIAQNISKLQLNEVISTDGLWMDTDQTIYATEGWNGDKVYKISPQGEVSVFASGLEGPIDILKGKDGSFYVSEWNAPQVSKIDQQGNLSKFADTKPGAGPMTMDEQGNIYVTHNVNDASGYISKITPKGKVSIHAEGKHLINPGGIDFDGKGNLYVSNFNDANIVKIGPDGSQKIIATIPGNQQWRTGHLKIINDTIYVTALMGHRIYTVSLDGKIEVLAGTGQAGNEVGKAKSIKLINPNGLFYDKMTEQLYFTIAFNKAGFIQKIDWNENTTFRSEYYAGIAFRETPYADIKGTRPLPKEIAEKVNHFQFDYDQYNRLVKVQYLLNGKLKAFKDRFVRAPKINIEYNKNQEIRTFYNEFGDRMVVSGDVYKSVFSLDENGDRTSLKFYDVNDNPTENDFRIASYEWSTNPDGTVIEKRYDIDRNIQRNRPGFGYYITKFTYDHRGLLRLMTNYGKEGAEITPDKAGIAHTKIGYDANTFFIQWLNLDEAFNPKRGMSNIAEIRYTPAPLYEHATSMFIDADRKPQTTNWGAHLVKYTHDNFGNVTSRRFFGMDKQPTNATNGVGWIKMTRTTDGMHEVSRSYFDKDENPTQIKGSGVHQVKTELDVQNRSIRKSFYNLKSEIVVDPSVGYATEQWIYSTNGHLIERKFFDVKGNPANHTTWGVARIVYTYKNGKELASVNYFDAAGKKTSANWNPRH